MIHFVTGMHRGGTHPYARWLAEEIQAVHLEEGVFSLTDYDKALQHAKLLESSGDVVIQCPGLGHRVLDLAKEGKVIWVTRRDPDHIVRAMLRAQINQHAWVFMRGFKESFPDDPVWDILKYDGGGDAKYGFVRYYRLLVHLKDYFFDKYFKGLAEKVYNDDQPYYDPAKCLDATQELPNGIKEWLRTDVSIRIHQA